MVSSRKLIQIQIVNALSILGRLTVPFQVSGSRVENVAGFFVWSAPAERSADGALDPPELRFGRKIQGGVAAALCHRTPNPSFTNRYTRFTIHVSKARLSI